MAEKAFNVVEFKGYGDDINIIFSDDAAFSDLEAELIRKLENSDQFFAGVTDVTVVLDMGDLDFIMSGGLGAIVAAHIRISRHGGQIRIAAARDHVLDMLERTALTRLFPVYASVEQALVPC